MRPVTGQWAGGCDGQAPQYHVGRAEKQRLRRGKGVVTLSRAGRDGRVLGKWVHNSTDSG